MYGFSLHNYVEYSLPCYPPFNCITFLNCSDERLTQLTDSDNLVKKNTITPSIQKEEKKPSLVVANKIFIELIGSRAERRPVRQRIERILFENILMPRL